MAGDDDLRHVCFELRTLCRISSYSKTKAGGGVKMNALTVQQAGSISGAGDDRIVLSGVLYPEITGGEVSLSLLTTQAYTGRHGFD